MQCQRQIGKLRHYKRVCYSTLVPSDGKLSHQLSFFQISSPFSLSLLKITANNRSVECALFLLHSMYLCFSKHVVLQHKTGGSGHFLPLPLTFQVILNKSLFLLGPVKVLCFSLVQ